MKIIIPLIIVGILLLGFIIPLFMPAMTACTEIYCFPANPNGENPCNSCQYSKPFFTLGIVNVIKDCQGTEIVIYQNSKLVDQRVDLSECKYSLSFFKLR